MSSLNHPTGLYKVFRNIVRGSVFLSGSEMDKKIILVCFVFLFIEVNCKRGTRINIYKQKGGDITQLRQMPGTPTGAMADLP